METSGEKMKDEFNIGEPEYVGNFPIRQDITVLPAGDPKKLRLGFKLYEGFEIHWPADGLLLEKEMSDPNNLEEIEGSERKKYIGLSHLDKEGNNEFAITKFSDLKVGDEIHTCQGLMKITDLNEAEQTGFARQSNYLGCQLEFAKDDRECWVSNNIIMCNWDNIKATTVNLGEKDELPKG